MATKAAPPIDLDSIKDDLGIPSGDTSHDAWLQRRIDGIWSRIERYTLRALRAPPGTFIDDWGLIAFNDRQLSVPPTWDTWVQPVTVFLRQFPVTSIVAISRDGSASDAASVSFDPKTGKLFNVWPGSDYAQDVSRQLHGSRVKITYTAGWDALPADLYEVVLGAMQQLWPARQAQSAGQPGTPRTIDIMDVGSVEFGSANAFLEGTMKGAGAVDDPLLGPYAALLDHYTDHRSRIGWAGQPASSELVVVGAEQRP